MKWTVEQIYTHTCAHTQSQRHTKTYDEFCVLYVTLFGVVFGVVVGALVLCVIGGVATVAEIKQKEKWNCNIFRDLIRYFPKWCLHCSILHSEKYQRTWNRNHLIHQNNVWGTCIMDSSRFRHDLFTCGCCWIHRGEGVIEAASCVAASHRAIGLRVTDTTVSAWVAASRLVTHILVSEKLIECTMTKDTFHSFLTFLYTWYNTVQMEIGKVNIGVVNINGWELQSIKFWLWLLIALPDKSSQPDRKCHCYWCTFHCILSSCTWRRGSISVVV